MLALALKQRPRGHDDRAADDDAGVALVVVLILMFLGAIAASAVAMMVVTTIQSTSSNKIATQEYVAAESGRDAAVATVAQGIKAGDGTLACSTGLTVAPGGDSTYSYTATVRWATAATQPDTWSTIAGGADSYTPCPTDSSNFVVIHATGTVPGGNTSEIDAAYAWSLQPDTRPAGTLAYFDGQFTATKSTYEGDLVIRGTDNYKCNNGAGNAIKGDLWVTNASVEVTGDCWVTGSIYAYGYVTAQNKNLRVGGDIITQTGDIDLKSDGVVVGGQLYAGHSVILDKSGTVGNGTTIKAVCGVNPSPATSCTLGAIPAEWTHTDLSVVTGQIGQPVPTITPTLRAVHDATAWLELDVSKNLSADSEVYPNPTTPDVCSSDDLRDILQTSGLRAFIDMSGCDEKDVLVQPAATTVARSAMVYVPSTSGMTLKLTNALSSGAGDPELLFIHGDANIADGKPTACATGADKLAVSAPIGVRTMIYSACGVNETMALTMMGQLYMGTDGLHLNGGLFDCAAMGWAPAFKNLACGVKGDDGVFDPNRKSQLIGALTRQTEVQ